MTEKQYVEYGKVFTHHDATDFQILDQSGKDILAVAGRDRCEQFIDWGLNFPQPPSKSPFIQKIPNHSAALLPFRGSYLFVQIQRREEGELARSKNVTPRINRPFNQVRFTLISDSQLDSYFKNNALLYTELLYKNKVENLGKHPNALKDYINPGITSPESLPNPDQMEKWLDKDNPFAMALVNIIAGTLKKKNTSLDLTVSCNELEWHQKLNIVQRAQVLLWPILGILTFTLDYISENSVNLRFYNVPLPKALGNVASYNLDAFLNIETELFNDLIYVSNHFSDYFSDNQFIEILRKYFWSGCTARNAALIAAFLSGKELPKGISIFLIISEKNNMDAIKANDDNDSINDRIKQNLPATDMLYALIDQAPIKLSQEAKQSLLLPLSNKISSVEIKDGNLVIELIRRFAAIIQNDNELLRNFSINTNEDIFKFIIKDINLYSQKFDNIAIRIFDSRTRWLFNNDLINKNWFEFYSYIPDDFKDISTLKLLRSAYVDYIEKDDSIDSQVFTEKIIDDLFYCLELRDEDEIVEFNLSLLMNSFPKDHVFFNNSLKKYANVSRVNWFEVVDCFVEDKNIAGLVWLLNSSKDDGEMFSDLLLRFLDIDFNDDEISNQADSLEKLIIKLKQKILVLQDTDKENCFNFINRLSSITFTKSNFSEIWFFDVVIHVEDIQDIYFYYKRLFDTLKVLNNSKLIFEKNPRLEKYLKINMDRDISKLYTLCGENFRLLYAIVKCHWSGVKNVDKIIRFFVDKISVDSISNPFLATIITDKDLFPTKLHEPIIQVQTLKNWLINTRRDALRKIYIDINTNRDLLREYAIAIKYLNDELGWEVFVNDFLSLFPKSFLWYEYLEAITNWTLSESKSKFSIFVNNIKPIEDLPTSNSTSEAYLIRLEALKALAEYEEQKIPARLKKLQSYIPKLLNDLDTLSIIQDSIESELPLTKTTQVTSLSLSHQADFMRIKEEETRQQYPRKEIVPLGIDADAKNWAREKLFKTNSNSNRIEDAEKKDSTLYLIGILILLALIFIFMCLAIEFFSRTFFDLLLTFK